MEFVESDLAGTVADHPIHSVVIGPEFRYVTEHDGKADGLQTDAWNYRCCRGSFGGEGSVSVYRSEKTSLGGQGG